MGSIGNRFALLSVQEAKEATEQEPTNESVLEAPSQKKKRHERQKKREIDMNLEFHLTLPLGHLRHILSPLSSRPSILHLQGLIFFLLFTSRLRLLILLAK